MPYEAISLPPPTRCATISNCCLPRVSSASRWSRSAHRLSTLQRPGNKGVPIFFASIDRAGNITKRHSATKLQFARFGAACPLWNAHQAFEVPQAHHPPACRDARRGALSLSGTADPSRAPAVLPRTRSAAMCIAFGCEVSYAGHFVYADDLDITDRAASSRSAYPAGICERGNCPSRAVPPIRGRLQVDPDIRETIPYRLA
jgi:predicted transcriptional regulator